MDGVPCSFVIPTSYIPSTVSKTKDGGSRLVVSHVSESRHGGHPVIFGWSDLDHSLGAGKRASTLRTIVHNMGLWPRSVSGVTATRTTRDETRPSGFFLLAAL